MNINQLIETLEKKILSHGLHFKSLYRGQVIPTQKS